MCTRPLRYWQSDCINPTTKKFYGFITGYDFPYAVSDDFKKRGMEASRWFATKDFIEVPCGKCPECLNQKKMRWVARCLAEKETSKYSYFLTITYNDDHLIPYPQLREMQHFINRLRKYMKFRYLVVGEKGDRSDRAHYHMILFSNDPLDDLELLKRGDMPLYRSPLLEKCWDSKGYISVGGVNASSIAYTIGYMVSREKKTVFKSQSQGLGADYFHALNDRYILASGNGHEIVTPLPRYLKEKYGLKYQYDKDLQAILWNNKVIASGLDEEDYRDFVEYLAKRPMKKGVV